jgi:hypothetical protein
MRLSVAGERMETYTTLVASTSNVTEKDAGRLEADTGELVVRTYEYGIMVFVGDPACVSTADDAEDAGYSESLVALIRYAAENGHRWIELDRDADPIEGEIDDVSEFEW